jgi:YD repeat-containing protein
LPVSLRGYKNGQDLYWFNYGYDAAARLKTVTAGVYTVTYDYYPTSSLIRSVVFKSNDVVRLTVRRGYDALGRLTGLTNTPAAGPEMSLAYAYDLANRRTAVTNAEGARWEYGYNGRGELTNAVRKWADGTALTEERGGAGNSSLVCKGLGQIREKNQFRNRLTGEGLRLS